MSKVQSNPSTGEITAKNSFSYRCFVNKDFTQFDSCSNLTNAFHLEQVEGNEVVIVEDRKDDWFELAQKDVDKVGLANILEICRRQQEDPYDGRYAYKDSESLDLGDLDAKDPESIQKAASSVKSSGYKLEAISKSLGISSEDLVKAVLGGTLETLLSDKLKTKETVEKEEVK